MCQNQWTSSIETALGEIKLSQPELSSRRHPFPSWLSLLTPLQFKRLRGQDWWELLSATQNFWPWLYPFFSFPSLKRTGQVSALNEMGIQPPDRLWHCFFCFYRRLNVCIQSKGQVRSPPFWEKGFDTAQNTLVWAKKSKTLSSHSQHKKYRGMVLKLAAPRSVVCIIDWLIDELCFWNAFW